ncbi:uncharacterized protein [Dysidea avara]|uniref:uncharacterized protein n=1 Tax=Dysidea avara TaxID=196820 RepID=UPI003318A4AB
METERSIRISIASQLDIIDIVEEDSKAIMLYTDKSIYNMLKRSTVSKPTYSSLGLDDAEQKVVLQKTGPCPEWYSRWRTREFALKGNFLYYYKAHAKNKDDIPILGAIYIRGAAIDEDTVKGSNNVIIITPQVPRRVGMRDDETSVFYIKCSSVQQRTELSKILKEIANKR